MLSTPKLLRRVSNANGHLVEFLRPNETVKIKPARKTGQGPILSRIHAVGNVGKRRMRLAHDESICTPLRGIGP